MSIIDGESSLLILTPGSLSLKNKQLSTTDTLHTRPLERHHHYHKTPPPRDAISTACRRCIPLPTTPNHHRTPPQRVKTTKKVFLVLSHRFPPLTATTIAVKCASAWNVSTAAGIHTTIAGIRYAAFFSGELCL